MKNTKKNLGKRKKRKKMAKALTNKEANDKYCIKSEKKIKDLYLL